MSLRLKSFRFAILAVILAAVFSYAGSALAESSSRETPVVKAVRLAGPAVVNINTTQIVDQRTNPFWRFEGDDFFNRFFRDFFETPGLRQRARTSLGSGVIIDGKRGYILTNEHVVARASEIKVTLGDEQEFTAELVGSDPDSDLAVLQIKSNKELPYLKMGDSSDLMIGEQVIAIGNPFGLTHTVTTGVISALNRHIRTNDRVYRDFIQTDASINPGNSGGPLLNINGELVGINTAIHVQAHGIGFAIPINKAKRIIKSLISYGQVLPVWLGLSLQDLNQRLAAYFKTPNREGILITGIDPDGPVAGSGLARGDVIVRIDRQQIRSIDDYEDILRSYTDQEKIKLTVYRQGRPREFSFKVKTFPLKKAMKISFDRYGLSLKDKGLSRQRRSGLPIARVRRDSPASRIGLRPGDIVHQINEIRINNLDDYLKAMAKYRLRHSLGMVVQRGRYAYHVTLTP
ncbi:MAG: trypsin-like peptidase domain-containing protein [Deltaproteobacteria bacterium]|nr:trypsin-like peptidase domain-containing protein [Deltaproteobacteria bacterium]MBW2084964.1 trypsin-like peptidase domain-containing protein [Deltaproteobacteria bacterium]